MPVDTLTNRRLLIADCRLAGAFCRHVAGAPELPSMPLARTVANGAEEKAAMAAYFNRAE